MTVRLPLGEEVHVWFVRCDESEPVARRGVARYALAEIVRGYSPRARVVLRPARRPEIVGSPLCVSLTRGGDLSLIAVATASRGVGVDVETVRPAPPAAVVGQLLTTREAHALDRLDDVERDAAFMRAWVRKEAALKAVGVGLAIEPCLVEVGVEHEGARVVAVPGKGDVTVRDLEFDGNVAAVAARGATPLAIRRLDWVSPREAAARRPAHAVPALLP